MQANLVNVRAGPPSAPPAAFDYSAMRKAALELREKEERAAQESLEEEECTAGEDDEECVLKW
jgi:hypothetical protein